tara:strand:- start:184 stop:507 length:324 start_codon:yes stop_codon:yes gene_type:complete
MVTIFVIFQVIIAISLVVVILLQHGKGADIGSAFGGGANNAMFSPADSTNILTKITWGLVVLFFLITVGISLYQKVSLDTELDVFTTLDDENTEIFEEKEITEDLPE